jgi:hypothetical protein
MLSAVIGNSTIFLLHSLVICFEVQSQEINIYAANLLAITYKAINAAPNLTNKRKQYPLLLRMQLAKPEKLIIAQIGLYHSRHRVNF